MTTLFRAEDSLVSSVDYYIILFYWFIIRINTTIVLFTSICTEGDGISLLILHITWGFEKLFGKVNEIGIDIEFLPLRCFYESD